MSFAAAPFHLDAAGEAWVDSAFAALTERQKLTQLFTLLSRGTDAEELDRLARFQPGGVTRHQGPDLEAERAVLERLNAASPVPLLVSADLEGSRMSLAGGIEFPNPLALAAVDDEALTEELSRLMAEEALARGINWSFTPLLDINAAWRSPIVATRGFGSDVDRIERHALAQIRGFRAVGVGATLKHWPGEGFDDRDQHLVTTINPLSLDEWERTFGRLYQAGIAAGALAVMSAHIAFPAFARAYGAEGLEAFRPASVSRLLNQTLLREHMGFQGLIVSDATPMAGLGAWGPRSQTLPELVASGCDVILFQRDPEEDLRYIEDALDAGRLEWSRVEDAVRRQLALKAALNLHKSAERPSFDAEPARAKAREAIRGAPTLVKDVRGTLPLSPERHRRVLVMDKGIVMPFAPAPIPFALPDMLAARGFEVTRHAPGTPIDPASFDLVLILHGEETLLTRGRIFLDWLSLTGHFGAAMERRWHEVPTVLVSFGYPYLLYDAPRVPTYVNAWQTTETMQEAVVDALLGLGPWNRQSPVDPFCGLEDARY
jgi:beta-N-acetylhexosaminidase